ncbi:hypothetical protein NDU88_001350 [Pleurodeles waltl]|uniref:Uncharacterized protein n=1 Tax=Pleurodeles waltl TaxID=8319 RepID=A0AAV7MSI1_PLEWA|nr:hypothetical protein NDU88_001350 [Pleurodeles waltl]
MVSNYIDSEDAERTLIVHCAAEASAGVVPHLTDVLVTVVPVEEEEKWKEMVWDEDVQEDAQTEHQEKEVQEEEW